MLGASGDLAKKKVRWVDLCVSSLVLQSEREGEDRGANLVSPSYDVRRTLLFSDSTLNAFSLGTSKSSAMLGRRWTLRSTTRG